MSSQRPSNKLLAVLGVTVLLALYVYVGPMLSGSSPAFDADVVPVAELPFHVEEPEEPEPVWVRPVEPRDPFEPTGVFASTAEDLLDLDDPAGADPEAGDAAVQADADALAEVTGEIEGLTDELATLADSAAAVVEN